MEAVGARLGRSSTRYGPSPTVFNGPVRKWKKKWVHVSSSSNNASSYHHSKTTNHNDNGTNGNNGSHLQLYKWTPITHSQNNNNNNSSNGDKSPAKDDVAASTNATSAVEEPPRRKFKYIPIAVLEEQNNEAVENETAEKVDDETKLSDTDSHAAEPISKNDGLDEKPDINDVPMEESQAPDDNPSARQDLNENTLDLSLGLKTHDGDPDSDVKRGQSKEGQLERVS